MALKRKLRKLGLLPGLESRPNRISVPESLEVIEVVQVRINVPESLDVVHVSIPKIKTRKRKKTRSKSIPKVNK